MKKTIAQFLDRYLGKTLLAIVFFVIGVDIYRVFGMAVVVVLLGMAVIALVFYRLFSWIEQNK